jgi:hypothetical protein
VWYGKIFLKEKVNEKECNFFTKIESVIFFA